MCSMYSVAIYTTLPTMIFILAPVCIMYVICRIYEVALFIEKNLSKLFLSLKYVLTHVVSTHENK